MTTNGLRNKDLNDGIHFMADTIKERSMKIIRAMTMNGTLAPHHVKITNHLGVSTNNTNHPTINHLTKHTTIKLNINDVNNTLLPSTCSPLKSGTCSI
jgi:hypothetical protein